jgi:hypothetical protein
VRIGVKSSLLTFVKLLGAFCWNSTIFWLKDENLEHSANLPPPDVIAAEIVEDLQAALAQFAGDRDGGQI